MTETEIKERNAVVTGAGSGIGLAIAQAFASAGYSVLLNDLNPESVQSACDVIRKAGGKAKVFVGDIGSEADSEALVAAAYESFGRLDVICNNAGVSDRATPVHEVDNALWEKIIRTSLSGPFFISRAALRYMMPARHGVFINIGSVAALRGGRSGAAYASAKHGLIGLTESIASAYGEYSIRCNAISPGSIKTGITSAGVASAIGQRLKEKGLATRPDQGFPEDIAPAAVFLASDGARYINGINLVIDGGWTAF